MDGVRALLLDIKLNNHELRLVHESLDFGAFVDEMESNLVPFLEEDETSVVSLYLQTVGDTNTGDDEAVRAEMLDKLKDAFELLTVKGLPLKELTFKYNDEAWSEHDDWPTISELVSSNQRLFVFSDRSEFISSTYGFMFNQQVLRENDWRGILSCSSRYMWDSNRVSLPNNSKWSRLFFMNHFCCDSGAGKFNFSSIISYAHIKLTCLLIGTCIASYGSTISNGSPLLGGGDNGWGILYNRIKMCMEGNGGAKPNFIALDWIVESEEARSVARYLNFGGAMGTRQLCESDDHCATSSCNFALGLCQCQECSKEGCGGCSNGQMCLSSGDGLNECRSIQSKQQDVTSQEQQNTTVAEDGNNETTAFYCGQTYFGAVENCTKQVQCPNGNSDCPEDEVCFGPFECVSSSLDEETQLTIEDILEESQSSPPASTPMESSSAVDLMPNISPSPFQSSIVSSSGPSEIETTEPPVQPATMYCGETYESAKDTCSDQTACPGGYECPSGTICYQGIKCFTRPPSKAPTSQPTTLPPTSSPSKQPSSRPTLAPTAPTKYPTGKPTFDFSNEYFCGLNYTNARETCYYSKPCPGGDPTICEEGQTCYSGIKVRVFL